MADESVKETSPVAQRLCSEIQLFDLCDLDSCHFKQSRFCTNEELVAQFEAIKEEDERNTLLYEGDEDDEAFDEESDFDGYDDSFDDDDENS